MSKAEKIKAEIERRYNILKNVASPENKDYYDGKIEAYLEMLNLLISQLGPVSNDLEEAADAYIKTHGEILGFGKQTFIAGAQWQKDHTYFTGRTETIEEIKESLLSEVLPCFMHGGEADEVVAKLDEVLNQK